MKYEYECKHDDIIYSGTMSYVGPLRKNNEPEYNSNAHNGVTYIEECAECGMIRYVNENHDNYEYGEWKMNNE